MLFAALLLYLRSIFDDKIMFTMALTVIYCIQYERTGGYKMF